MAISVRPVWGLLQQIVFRTDGKNDPSIMPARYGVTSFRQGPGKLDMVTTRCCSDQADGFIGRRLRQTLRTGRGNRNCSLPVSFDSNSRTSGEIHGCMCSLQVSGICFAGTNVIEKRFAFSNQVFENFCGFIHRDFFRG